MLSLTWISKNGIQRVESKKNDTNERIYKIERVTDVKIKRMVIRGQRGEGINWEVGIDMYTLLYIK